MSKFAGRSLQIDDEVYRSEMATNRRNQGIAHLLDSYDRERGAAADENLRISTRSTDFMTPKTRVARVLRDAPAAEWVRRLVPLGVVAAEVGTLNERGLGIDDCPVAPEKLRALLLLVENGTLAANQAKEVFTVLFDNPEKDPAAIADSLGFKPAEAGELEGLVDQVIANNPSEVEAVKAGNEKLLNFLTGQVMKSATTKPNPKQVSDLLRARLL